MHTHTHAHTHAHAHTIYTAAGYTQHIRMHTHTHTHTLYEQITHKHTHIFVPSDVHVEGIFLVRVGDCLIC